MILPFRGLRFNLQKVGIKDVVSQPYDVITEEMQKSYYDRSPYNIVRIILNREKNRYDAAKKYLHDWLSDGVLKIENKPAIYLYEQQFSVESSSFIRRGFISLVELHEFDEGIIFPHEHTLSAPKEDRYELTVATDTHWGQVFLLYDDDGRVKELLSPYYGREPEISFKDESGIVHRLWVIKDERLHGSLRHIMDGKKFVIADGHHRYETALRYKQWKSKDGHGLWDYRMATMVSFDDPGLVILPIHRLLKRNWKLDLNSIEIFDILRVKDIVNVRSVLSDAFEKGKKGVFGVFDREEGYYCISLKDERFALSEDGEHSKEWQLLDVNILQKFVIEPLFRKDVVTIAKEGGIGYEVSFERAERLVRDENYDICFFLNPVRKEQIRNISLSGERLPQKSTFFYPKILTGLVEQYMGVEL